MLIILIEYLKASIKQGQEAIFCFSIVFNVSPLGDIYFQKNWKQRDAKKSCKLESDVYHVASLPLSLILLSIVVLKITQLLKFKILWMQNIF